MTIEPTNTPINRSKRYPNPTRAFRSPKRISITVPYGAYQRLLECSDEQGRSLSNLAAFLLESNLWSQREERHPLL